MVRLPVSERVFDVRDPNGTIVPSDVSSLDKYFYEYPPPMIISCLGHLPLGISPLPHPTPPCRYISLYGYLLP